MVKTVCLIASLLALTAALVASAPAAAEPDAAASSCVSVRNVSGYTVIDDRNLVLRGGASRYYLVTMRTRCSGLRAGAQVGLSFPDTARICQPIAEFVTPEDGWRCAIGSIEEVESDERARALIEERAAMALARVPEDAE